MSWPGGNTMGRTVRANGFSGTSTRSPRVGSRIGPPLASAYAVVPVAVATITPYATGATIKDLVNESLIVALRDGRAIISGFGQAKAAQDRLLIEQHRDRLRATERQAAERREENERDDRAPRLSRS